MIVEPEHTGLQEAGHLSARRIQCPRFYRHRLSIPSYPNQDYMRIPNTSTWNPAPPPLTTVLLINHLGMIAMFALNAQCQSQAAALSTGSKD
jgi:hypothetical protein